MIYIIWLTLLALIIISFLTDKVTIWIPIVIYVIVVIFRAKEKVNNYNDWKKKIDRDEKFTIEKLENELNRRKVLKSGPDKKSKSRIKQDFGWKRKERKRKFENELINSLLLK